MWDGWQRPRCRGPRLIPGNVIKVSALPLDDLQPPVVNVTRRMEVRHGRSGPARAFAVLIGSIFFLLASQFPLRNRLRSSPD